MTGVAVKWYFEDQEGIKMDIQQEEKYINDKYESKHNKLFIKFINILHYAVKFRNISLEHAFEIVKK